jgi:hypothetical protein
VKNNTACAEIIDDGMDHLWLALKSIVKSPGLNKSDLLATNDSMK